ncbi:hypothetical protein BDV30DRAFT_239707 [Aspergillus minisclerotigenes]|uniref:Protein kinase domain-containing protein n=1 Tax=Aspergillus minisclerotigenes TaxID=656917 RepID=A0A5N6J015_9EURO|nr:hypothetical protein BDV30DRAFT_239707 [Aspergillus minisclerotigenes]
MVLEPFEKTLWSARSKRPLTLREVKHIMKFALLGLQEIHEKGLVYCDFKMENVLLNGFDDENPFTDDENVPMRFFHLLQAQIDFQSPGIYDSIIKDGTFEHKIEAIWRAQCHDFDLRSVEYFQDCDFINIADEGGKGGLNSDEHWTDHLVSLGVPEYDVVFLYPVLQPDPTKTMTVAEILDTGYLDVY